jgi:hypothetical protein
MKRGLDGNPAAVTGRRSPRDRRLSLSPAAGLPTRWEMNDLARRLDHQPAAVAKGVNPPDSI